MRVREFKKKDLQVLEARMRSSKYGQAVFLGKDEPLLESCDHDLETLRRIDKTPEDISSRLEELTSLYERQCMRESFCSDAKWDSFGGRVLNHAGLAIRGVHYTTYPEFCPFGPEMKVAGWSPVRGLLVEEGSGADQLHACAGQADLGTWDFYIERLDNNAGIFFGDLVIHTSVAHHFFEGQVTKYRLDPLRAAYVLGMIDEATYISQKSRERLHDPGMQF